MSGRVVVFPDIVIDALLKGLQILAINFLVDRFVFKVHPGGLALIDIDLAQQGLPKVLLVPRGEDDGIVDLAQVGECLAFVDFLFDGGEDDFADDFGGNGCIVIRRDRV